MEETLKYSCSNCHKKLTIEKFERQNYKNNDFRVFKTCNWCYERRKIKELKPKMELLFNKINDNINFISPFNNDI